MSYSYPDPPKCCSSSASAELKLYQAFIFSVPILFTFILLFLFYLFYLRRQRVDWASLRMRPSPHQDDHALSEAAGLKREVREMLPIIGKNKQGLLLCSVCLGDYQADDKLQQIPACGHTFHMKCIDHWLATHTTCPLCRLSLVPPPKTNSDLPPSTDTDPQIEAQQASQAHLVLNEHPSNVVNDVDIESGCRHVNTMVEREQGAYSDSQRSKGENEYCDSDEEDQHDAATSIGDEEEEEEEEVWS
ncbi:hypothetical protein Syun_013472 [Stephania yunnanensis]|uniref:RING-type E3 ubiquitin transferase n=1 Tax=Stephania yunnanensis TaxID=152371 RepID=A0AAP0JHQ6_9MAGN